MKELEQIARWIRERNLWERQVSSLIGRPALIGHIGEYIAAHIFHIALLASASHKSIDGHFTAGPLLGRTVNIKWYGYWESLLDVTPAALPDFYLVMTGPKRVQRPLRPWSIENVFLFEAEPLVSTLKASRVKMGIATSVRRNLWDQAEIYPHQRNQLLVLSAEQRAALELFSLEVIG